MTLVALEIDGDLHGGRVAELGPVPGRERSRGIGCGHQYRAGPDEDGVVLSGGEAGAPDIESLAVADRVRIDPAGFESGPSRRRWFAREGLRGRKGCDK